MGRFFYAYCFCFRYCHFNNKNRAQHEVNLKINKKVAKYASTITTQQQNSTLSH